MQGLALARRLYDAMLRQGAARRPADDSPRSPAMPPINTRPRATLHPAFPPAVRDSIPPARPRPRWARRPRPPRPEPQPKGTAATALRPSCSPSRTRRDTTTAEVIGKYRRRRPRMRSTVSRMRSPVLSSLGYRGSCGRGVPAYTVSLRRRGGRGARTHEQRDCRTRRALRDPRDAASACAAPEARCACVRAYEYEYSKTKQEVDRRNHVLEVETLDFAPIS